MIILKLALVTLALMMGHFGFKLLIIQEKKRRMKETEVNDNGRRKQLLLAVLEGETGQQIIRADIRRQSIKTIIELANEIRRKISSKENKFSSDKSLIMIEILLIVKIIIRKERYPCRR